MHAAENLNIINFITGWGTLHSGFIEFSIRRFYIMKNAATLFGYIGDIVFSLTFVCVFFLSTSQPG
jgi:hypothetical protein